MHMVIVAIVYAHTELDALRQAHKVFSSLTREGHPFDYFTTFEHEGSPSSGRGRWGNLCPVAEATSEAGKRLIQGALKATRDEFIEIMGEIRQSLEHYSDEQLFEGEDEVNGLKGFFRYRCILAGRDKGHPVRIYDCDGEGIPDTRTLNEALAKWKGIYEGEGKKNPYAGMKVWAVPADAHS